ncbi:MAG: type IX secretion system sortase PorU [Candidatus Marinimicrobia bacterium]|nr:type IX secretion system sortase PorU [Candidatus Neomarinimicrobiota bacterium]
MTTVIRPALSAALLLGLPLSAFGQGETVERLSFELATRDAVVRADDRQFYLSTAAADIAVGQRQVSVHRWLVSVAGIAHVKVRLLNPVWTPMAGAHANLADLEAVDPVRVHSAQIRGSEQIALIDVLPWRASGGVLERLTGGTAEITLSHPASAPRRAATRRPDLANQFIVAAPARRAAAKSFDPLPTGGQWLKIPLREDGIYHLTTAYITASGATLSGIGSAALRLFAPSSLGRVLTTVVGAVLPENMVELPLLVRDGDDGRMDSSDEVIFYGQGPRGIGFSAGALDYHQNPYTDTAYVWLHLPADNATPGLRMESGDPYVSALSPLSEGRAMFHHEIDAFNGFSSGPVWHQNAIPRGSSFSVTFDAPNLIVGDATLLKVRLRGGNESFTSIHRIALGINATEVFRSSTWGAHGDWIFQVNSTLLANAVVAGQNQIRIDNDIFDPDNEEEIWFDWAQIDYAVNLAAIADGLQAALVPRDDGANVRLSGFTAQPVVLDITDPARPRLQQLTPAGSDWEFSVAVLTAGMRLVAATDGQLLTPSDGQLLDNISFTDLRQPGIQADYIIITVPQFLNQAQQLADIHASQVRPTWRLRTKVVLVDEIYEEFSGGMADPYALRAFLNYAYDNWSTPTLVGLFGDGDYDYRNITGLSQQLLPTVQVDGVNEIFSRSADDRFVTFGTVSPQGNPLPDMGIGRMPVSTAAEADVLVETISAYMLAPEPGAWRQRILMAADDPVRPNDKEESFILDSEIFAKTFPSYLEVNKIYLTEYAEKRDPATNTIVKPDATEDLIRNINLGVALINYIGHGSASQWAQEALVKVDRDRPRFQPGNMLPVWYAGTCAWGAYDALDAPAMGEVLTASEDIAGIAVISATRAVFSSDNTRFVNRLFQNTFPLNQPTDDRIGVILQKAKLDDDDEKFHLFGDPAIRLAFPSLPLDTLTVSPDTLQVLGTSSYAGTVGAAPFADGTSLVTILDAPVTVTRQYRALTGEYLDITYQLPGAAIFRGKASITNNKFSGKFIIPKDISYSTTPIKVIGYAWADEGGALIERASSINNVIISGTASTAPDSSGPIISIFSGGRMLQAEETLRRGARITVNLQDPLGINLTGEIGHSILLWLDEETDAIAMNNAFEYDLDNHTGGRFAYTIDSTLTGRHELWVQAWDGANNRSRKSITLNLNLSTALDVDDIYNYPNPFAMQTRFFYVLSQPAEVTITIFTINGAKILTLESLGLQDAGPQRLPETGQWDGNDEFGDSIANGAYLYRFRAKSPTGDTVVKWGRLARLR